MSEPFGLYIHIPFCSFSCHYCDFAKTANFDNLIAEQYFTRLLEQANLWCRWLEYRGQKLSSVFLGGGTPGLFSSSYAPVFDVLRASLGADAEITLEANPGNITTQRLQEWRQLGINRLSIGIQTFQDGGLMTLTRQHSAAQARESVIAALSEFANVNIDLIYGWPGQTHQAWLADLEQAQNLKVPHLSLYNLTFEPRTPIGRAWSRGKLKGPDDSELLDFYQSACQILAGSAYEHEEVSNWTRAGFSCRHNWLYWLQDAYIGIGAGAHGYLPQSGEFGLRYALARNERHMLRQRPEVMPSESWDSDLSADLVIRMIGGEVEQRGAREWLIEMVAARLRTRAGVDVENICQRLGADFRPGQSLLSGIAAGQIRLDGRFLHLNENEWFRENFWCLEVIDAFETK